jgi:hypothetical protein
MMSQAKPAACNKKAGILYKNTSYILRVMIYLVNNRTRQKNHKNKEAK